MKLLLRPKNHFYSGSKLEIVSNQTLSTCLLKKVFLFSVRAPTLSDPEQSEHYNNSRSGGWYAWRPRGRQQSPSDNERLRHPATKLLRSASRETAAKWRFVRKCTSSTWGNQTAASDLNYSP